MAGRKRPRSSSDSMTSTNKHKVGGLLRLCGRKIFHGMFLSMIVQEVLSPVCFAPCVSSTTLCKQHHMKQRNGIETASKRHRNMDGETLYVHVYTLLRRAIIQRHKDSKMHKEAEELEKLPDWHRKRMEE